MGCSWYLFFFFAQSVTETIASRAPALDGLSSLHDKAKDLVLGRRVAAQAYHVYVDNLGVIAKTQQEADIVLVQWKHFFTENSRTLHKLELSQKVKSLGVELDFVLLGARPALCTLHTCYRFVRAHYHVANRLWTETPAELVAVRSLLIFSQSEWTRTWNTRVFSTDSSLSGWRMTNADWPKEVAGRTGRVSERRRFISNGPGARKSALAASRVVLDDDQWIVEGADDEDEEASFNIDPSSEEVPSGWLEPSRVKISSFWKQERG